jgi:hypothetical protein
LRGAAYSGFLQQSCTGCHSTVSDPALVADGVSCESCHGPASRWLSTHTRAGAQHAEEMQDTLSLHSRAKICAGCHVGPRQADERLYDVNHDLIAAGHPRLTFEFTAYLNSMPPHWRPSRTGWGIEAWTAGQAATAQASLKLLGARARGSNWPEFAEYDCYACHHDLQSGREAAGTALGKPAWGVWGYTLPRATAANLTPIRKEMVKPAPDPRVVEKLAAAAAESIQPVALGAETLEAALRAEMPAWRHWEEWAQAYLAARAIAQPSRRPALRELRALLEARDRFNPRDQELLTTVDELLKP